METCDYFSPGRYEYQAPPRLEKNTPVYLEGAIFLIYTHIGTLHTHTLAHSGRLGSVFLFEDPLPSNVVQHVYTLGPSYYGSFQAPVLQDRVSKHSFNLTDLLYHNLLCTFTHCMID